MSQGPWTLGTMITSSLSPISVTSCVKSSRHHGLSSSFTRVQSCVSPKSTSLATSISPSRAGTFLSIGIASSRLPSRMSACLAMSGTLARIFSFDASKKWIIREGLKGISRGGSGAPSASGWKKSRGFLMRGTLPTRTWLGSPHGPDPRSASGRGRAHPRHVRVALRAARIGAAALGSRAGAGGDRWCDRGPGGGRAGRRASGRAARAVHRLPRHELGPLRRPLLDRGPGGQPRASLAGGGEGPARSGQGVGPPEGRDAPRARQRRYPRGRPPLLRAGETQLDFPLLRLGDLETPNIPHQPPYRALRDASAGRRSELLRYIASHRD